LAQMMCAKCRENQTKTVGVAIWKKFDDTGTDRPTDTSVTYTTSSAGYIIAELVTKSTANIITDDDKQCSILWKWYQVHHWWTRVFIFIIVLLPHLGQIQIYIIHFFIINCNSLDFLQISQCITHYIHKQPKKFTQAMCSGSYYVFAVLLSR